MPQAIDLSIGEFQKCASKGKFATDPVAVGARQLTTILPALTLAEAIETTRIHRVAGLTGARTVWVTTRPCRAPTTPSRIRGGSAGATSRCPARCRWPITAGCLWMRDQAWFPYGQCLLGKLYFRGVRSCRLFSASRLR